MYIQKITIDVESDRPKELLLDEFYWLISMYRKSGQIQIALNTQYISGDKMTALVYTMEKSSLSPKHNNSYVNAQIAKLEGLCDATLKTKLLGTEFVGSDPACTCSHPRSYTLNALYMSRESALYCNDCKNGVPLYRLPKFENDDYEPIINWHLSSLCINGLETTNLRENSFPEVPVNLLSAIDKQAERICKHIKKHTGITVYKLSANPGEVKGKVDRDELEMVD